MTDLEKLTLLYKIVEAAFLNGPDRDMARKCANELAEVLKPKEKKRAPLPE